MYSMHKNKFKPVINNMALGNFDRISGNRADILAEDDVVPIKQVRDPKRDKDRDMRKLSKKDRWDD